MIYSCVISFFCVIVVFSSFVTGTFIFRKVGDGEWPETTNWMP